MFQRIYAVYLKCLFSLGLLVLVGLPALGQSASSAAVKGVVQDTSDASIPNAQVKLINTDTGTESHTTTNNSGHFTVPSVIPGHYTLQIERDGFATTQLTGITLNVGDNKDVLIHLKVGSASESIQVDGSGATINTADSSVSTVIDRIFVENIPLNGRSFQSLESLVPGTALVPSKGVGLSGEIVVNGQRTEANYFSVDGVSANTSVNGSYSAGNGAGYSGSVPGETALGTTQSLVSIDALQEFRATTSTYSAEYGRSPGGQFSFVTRSGNNALHGSIYDYFRNDVLDANNWFNDHTVPATKKTAERQNDFGGTFGGPVWITHLYNGREKTFFFLSYEGLRLRIPYAASTTSVPNAALRATAPQALQCVLNSFPLPNGADLGNDFSSFSQAYSAPSSLNSTSLRIDHHFNKAIHLFSRYSYSPSSSVKRYVSDLAITQSSVFDSQPLTAGLDNAFGTHAANEFRFNLTRMKGNFDYGFTDFGGATPFSLSTVPGPNGGSLPAHSALSVSFSFGSYPGISYFPNPVSQQQWNITDSLTRQFGNHAFKFGMDYRRLTTRPSEPTFSETVVFTSLAQVLANSASYAYIRSYAATSAEPIYTNLSLFAQDEWKIAPRLSASLGVRWDLNPPPGDAYGNIPYTLNEVANLATAVVAPKGTPLWKTRYANFAPRAGIAYQLHPQNKLQTVLRVGGGLFYDTGNTEGSLGLSGLGYTVLKTVTNVAFPLSGSNTTVPTASIAAPYNGTVYAFDPKLKSPYTMQWSAALEQAFGENQTLTISYIGNGARGLLNSYNYYPGQLGNANFTSTGAAFIVKNQAASGYNALQVQYNHHLSKGLQVLLNYTWSHSLDNNTSSLGTNAGLLRGNSDYDVRNNFRAAVTYNIPGKTENRFASVLVNHWSVDARVTARSAFPIDAFSGYTPTSAGFQNYVRADMVPGVPVYLKAPSAPGKRVINLKAFTTPSSGYMGNEPRNFLRSFASWQPDLSIRRQFALTEKANLQLRAESFNLINHPNFGAIYNNISSTTQFGYAYNTLNGQLGGLNSLYQIGGPRSIQLMLKCQF